MCRSGSVLRGFSYIYDSVSKGREGVFQEIKFDLTAGKGVNVTTRSSFLRFVYNVLILQSATGLIKSI